MSYKQTYATYTEVKASLEERVWHMIKLAEQDDECKYLYRVNIDLPSTYMLDWDVTHYECNNGIRFTFDRTESYEDWSENAEVSFSWEELEYTNGDIITMWKERGKVIYNREVDEADRQLKYAAKAAGYKLVKEESRNG